MDKIVTISKIEGTQELIMRLPHTEAQERVNSQGWHFTTKKKWKRRLNRNRYPNLVY